jgi:hypothetical protein
LINKKYSSDYQNKDRLTLIKQHLTKLLQKEIDNCNKINSNYISLKSNSNTTEHLPEEGEKFIDEDESLNQQYKAGSIKLIDDIANYRNAKYQNIYQETLYLKKVTNDLNLITNQQHEKIEKIDENIDTVLHNAKESHNILIKTAKEEKIFRENKCCIILLISLALFLLILLMLNMNR